MAVARGVKLVELDFDEFEKRCNELRKGMSYFEYDSERNRHVLVPHFAEAPRVYIYEDNTPIFSGGFVMYRIKRICVEDKKGLVCYEPKERDGHD